MRFYVATNEQGKETIFTSENEAIKFDYYGEPLLVSLEKKAESAQVK